MAERPRGSMSPFWWVLFGVGVTLIVLGVIGYFFGDD
jgi:fumarate reductase subunit D